MHDSCISVVPDWSQSRCILHPLHPTQSLPTCPLEQEVEADPECCSVTQDTAGAVPFVPGTPGGSPLRQGFSAATALGNAPGTASRATDGWAVGSAPMQQQRGDDSAKAGPSQGNLSSSCALPPPRIPPWKPALYLTSLLSVSFFLLCALPVLDQLIAALQRLLSIRFVAPM